MKKKPDAIPLEALLDAPGFERNCEILLSEAVDSLARPILRGHGRQ